MNCWVLVTVHVFPNQERHGENWLSCYLAVRWWKGPWFFRKSPEMSHKWVNYLLVGGWPTPLKNISQIGSSSQLLGKIKKCSKPPTSLCFANDFWDSPPLKSFGVQHCRSPQWLIISGPEEGIKKIFVAKKVQEQPASNASIKSPIVAAEMSQHVGRWNRFLQHPWSPRSDFVIYSEPLLTMVGEYWIMEYNMEYNIE